MRRSLLAAAAVFLLAGCGGGSSTSSFPSVPAARTYQIVDFKPTGPVTAGKPTQVSFVIKQPNGKPMTSFKRGPGPHTGVHVIFVRRDLASIIHVHPPVASDGTIRTTIPFAKPGPYRMVVDVYPNTTGPQRNFQLSGSLRVAGDYRPDKLPPFKRSVDVDGYRYTLQNAPTLHAIQAGFLNFRVTDPQGKPVRFSPWFGALAHAIFFRTGTLDYFHTHVCSAGATGCTSSFGGRQVTGTSSAPGTLNVGVLVPVPGTWQLFLQSRVNGRVLTAPFTLKVRP